MTEQPDIQLRLARIEAMVGRLLDREVAKEWYSVEEFARLVGKSCFTCRQWCNLGRVNAGKSMTRTGASQAWVISHGELERYRREGLLPLARHRAD